ncbi:hypothetical protein [Muribaculum intestinale]|uniref:hypothetical protein n=1 Tax=Muribaculum intestinale TaxID=1796646 RepID=UPI00272A9DB8|nr:hypothetical protein [Muribaculum intestinale]
MCKILPQIKELALHEGITIGALERAIGASKGVLSRAISNGTDIQSKWIQAIVENYPQYSAQWLLTGMGEMTVTPTIASKEASKNDPEITKSESSPILVNVPLEVHNNMINLYEDKIQSKDQEIGNLREEIGKLKATIAILEKEKEQMQEQDAKNIQSYARSMTPETVET